MFYFTDILNYTFWAFVILIALMSACIVKISYLFYWYELATIQPKLIKVRFRPARLKKAIALLASEFMATYVSWLLYPIGWLPISTLCLRKQPSQTIVLLHGLFQNRACCFWLQLRLALHGHRVITLTMPPWKQVESLSEQLDQTISRLRQNKNIQRIDLISHSMGGIIARNYIQRRGGAANIRTCITLGTPHSGSKMSSLAFTKLARTLIPNNTLLNQLNQKKWPENLPFTAIYSVTDNLVLPTDSGHCSKANNIIIPLCGHMLLLYHPAVFNHLLVALNPTIDGLAKTG
ncbi:MAG: alpha/beta hydrolase [Thermodesulfobacteriota bacterium]|nr:alpha/beta hydrolase [Thermodesulfobacteriota bacterium]